jgi:hypothetical protein
MSSSSNNPPPSSDNSTITITKQSDNPSNSSTVTINKSSSNQPPPPPDNSSNPPPPDNSSNPPPPQDNSSQDDVFTYIQNNALTPSVLMMVVWFIVIYFVAYFILGLLFKGQPSSFSSVYTLLDILIFGTILLFLLFSYYNKSPEEKDNTLSDTFKDIKDYVTNPYAFINAFIFLAILHIILYLFRIPTTGSDKPYFVGFFLGCGWIVFVISLIVWVFDKFFNISLFDGSWWDKISENKPLDTDKQDDKVEREEVFNISNNLYTYDDAKAVCSAYGARLANYKEIEDAYNRGGEWCNYGWSDGQMAYFPTQQSTWDELQKNPKHKNDCGRPGVNGGFMANPYIKFGVNCYGKKPKPTDRDLQEMDANKNVVVPKTPEEQELDKKVEFWKENADKLLNVNSFNRDKWSEY